MLSEKPSMRSLRYVIEEVAPHSTEIAIELGLERYLRRVETDHPHNCMVRCQKIFRKFLEGRNATWGEVLRSIRKLNYNAIADDIEKQLPEIFDEEESRVVHDEEESRDGSSQQERLKIDMLTLLLSLQSEMNKIPHHAFGWLVDVQAVLKRITHLVHIGSDEQKMINDPTLELTHRTLYLAILIKDKGKGREVCQMLCDLYCITDIMQENPSVTSSAYSSEPMPPPPSVHHHHCHTSMASAAASYSDSDVVTETAEIFDSPLHHQATDFLQNVDSNTLAPHLFENGLLTADDLERLQLSLVTRSDKVNFLLCKLLYLGKEGFKVFMNCLLKANDHAGHKELYKKLST